MKKIAGLTILMILSIGSFAQGKWYVSPSTSYAGCGDNDGWAANMQVGRYVDHQNTLRIDIQGNYLFSNQNLDYQTVTLLATTEGTVKLLGADRIYSSTSLGIGVMTSSLTFRESAPENFTDIIVPVKLAVGYRLSDHFSIGTDLSYNFNLNQFKGRSVAYVGIHLGFRF